VKQSANWVESGAMRRSPALAGADDEGRAGAWASWNGLGHRSAARAEPILGVEAAGSCDEIWDGAATVVGRLNDSAASPSAPTQRRARAAHEHG
jgi:hypothetical protein